MKPRENRARRFEREVNDFAATVVGKRILSVAALFNEEKEPIGILVHLDDGSSFVAREIGRG
jgi:hypothetical protein